jgi:hypothetical protein
MEYLREKKKVSIPIQQKVERKKPTKIEAENTTFEKDILISLEHLVVFSV